jgi:hypothetical protein
VVGINGTIVYNQSRELTGILSLAPGQEARWKSYIRAGQRNPFNFTDLESLSARLTIGAFERYIIEQSSPYPSSSPPSPSPSPPSSSPAASSPSPFLSGSRDYRLQSLLSFHVFNLSDPPMKCSGVCRARFGTNLLIER